MARFIQFCLFVLLAGFPFGASSHEDVQEKPAKKEACGQQGTIDERIDDCDDTRKGWRRPPIYLVSRTKEGKEIWLEAWQDTNGEQRATLWGSRLNETMNHQEALDACASGNRPEHGTLSDLPWRLPRFGEYHRIRDSKLGGNNVYKYFESFFAIHFGKKQWFWTGTLDIAPGTAAYRFNIVYGDFVPGPRHKRFSVRCTVLLTVKP